MSSGLLSAALALASGETLGRACPVFPLQSAGKRPLPGSSGWKDATVDSDRIHAWWADTPDANIGLSLEGARLAVLDIEGPSHGQNRDDVIAAIEQAMGPIPATRAADTAGGGRHFYFAISDGVLIPTHVTTPDGEPIEGVEVRRPGMYVVTPPSVRQGGWWAWINDLPIISVPHWMRAEAPEPRPIGERSSAVFGSGAKGTSYGLAGIQGELRGIASAISGHRRVRCYAAAAACAELAAAGQLDEQYAVDELIAAAKGAFEPEWPEHEADVIRSIHDGWIKGWAKPRLVAPLTAGTTTAEASTEDEDEDEFYIPWPDFWSHEDDEDQWLLDNILARGRGHSIYAAHKVGKSLVMLWCALELVRAGVVVIYLDFEMTWGDIRERLEDMEVGPETDLSLLRYATLPSLPPLDTSEGGQALMEKVEDERAAHPDAEIVVVIDTIGRAVMGEENPADTIQAFYRHTGMRLKRSGITWARLDHSGWEGKHARGSSAKGDDVDVIWQLVPVDGGLELRRTAARPGWVPEKVTLHMLDAPLSFEQVDESWPNGTLEVAGLLNGLAVPLDASRRTAADALREDGHKWRNAVVGAACRWRRIVAENSSGTTSGTTGTTTHDTPGDHSGTTPENPVTMGGDHLGTTGTTNGRATGTIGPPYVVGGHGTGPSPGPSPDPEEMF